jgi:quercetin dioxygenase-like cupin family protein
MTGRDSNLAIKKKLVTKKKAATKNATNKKAVRKAAKKDGVQYIPWSTVPLDKINPLIDRQFVVGQEVMVARVIMKRGAIVPLHSHHNEQITYILSGALKFWIDGKVIVVNAGEVLTIPPHMPHRAEALEDTVDLDVFNPPRADWMAGTDVYLRDAENKKNTVVPHIVG